MTEIIRNYLSFIDSSSYLTFSHNENFDLDTGGTFSFWMKKEIESTDGCLLFKRQPTDRNDVNYDIGFYINFVNSGSHVKSILIKLDTIDNDESIYSENNYISTDDYWHFYTIVCDVENSKFVFYRDASEISESSFSTDLENIDNSASLNFGGGASTTEIFNSIQASLDDFRFYKSISLTQDNINYIFNKGYGKRVQKTDFADIVINGWYSDFDDATTLKIEVLENENVWTTVSSINYIDGEKIVWEEGGTKFVEQSEYYEYTGEPDVSEKEGGFWYYIQNKHGSNWFDTVDNSKGWTIDFNLRVNDVTNTNSMLKINDQDGAGIYVNDGTRMEVINFLTQEIIFTNSDYKIIYDTTTENDYRLIGKKNELKLFAKPSSAEENDPYSLLAKVAFLTSSSMEGNSFSPSIVEDSDENIHAVWADDGKVNGQIYYSKFYENTWSEPEQIVSDERGCRKPNIIIDNEDNIYVCYELNSGETSIVGIIYKNSLGWSNPYFAGINVKNPKVTFDSFYNLFVAWEDERSGHSQIYFRKLNKETLSWDDEIKITDSSFGSKNVSIDSFSDDVFFSWTTKNTDGTSFIQVRKYNFISEKLDDAVTVSSNDDIADYSDILINSSAKVFVCWSGKETGRYEIYVAELNTDLEIQNSKMALTDSSVSNGGCLYPVLSEQYTTGDVYFVWQDFKDETFDEFNPTGDSQMEYGDYPVYTTLKVAYYNNLNDLYYSSGGIDEDIEKDNDSATDVSVVFSDGRIASRPSVSKYFRGNLAVSYEAFNFNADKFFSDSSLLKFIGCFFYEPQYDESTYSVTDDVIDPYGETNKIISGENYKKELRFGDFSNNVNVHYIFKNFKYYTDDAVEAYHLKEITANDYDFLETLNASDVAVNNYGDVWIVGTCGMLYYISRNSGLVLVGSGEDIDPNNADITGHIKSIAFDKYNVLYISNAKGIFYSQEHISNYSQVGSLTYGSTSITPSKVSSIAFDKNNKLIFSTDSTDSTDSTGNVLYIANLIENKIEYKLTCSDYITSIVVDDNNVIWVGTFNGLYRVHNYNYLRYTTANGLSSNRINDITIRNTAIRYIATGDGIDKMIGSAFSDSIKSDNSSLWNNNVKSVLWQDPNILWAGTMSKVNQIIINDISDNHTITNYEPLEANVIKEDDYQLYYILLDEGKTIEKRDVLEVYINGNFIPHGYIYAKDSRTELDTIYFETPLKNDDRVEVVVRKDLNLKASFGQTLEEKEVAGERLVRIKDLVVGTPNDAENNNIFINIGGYTNEVKIDDSLSNLPFDRVHLDTEPPQGTIVIDTDGQIDRTTIKVNITNVSDDNDGIVGSGVDKMVISNNSNFTTDGLTPQTPIPFASSSNHDLGVNIQNTVKDSISSGVGSKIQFISEEENQLFYASSLPAKVYKFDNIDNEWDLLFSYEEDNYVDFIVKYNNQLIVSVGHATGAASLYIYDYVLVDSVFSSFSLSSRLSIGESRIFSYQILNNLLYMGSGIGSGNEYADGMGSHGGKLYSYDGESLSTIVSDIDDNIYDLTSVDGTNNLLAATGESGFVYEIDTENENAFPIHNDVESIRSICYIQFDGDSLIFAGGEESGVIRRSDVDTHSFDVSFKTSASKISSLKILGGTDNKFLYAAVGNVLYYLSSSGTWVWRYSHTETINDITMKIDSTNNDEYLYLISDSQVVRINPLLQERNIYLKLIDRAGNETVLYDSDGNVKTNLTASISIENLADFINENRIFELDELGNTVFTIKGNNRFYSGNRISEEKGIYTSEIFDATNDIVKWDKMTWQATEMSNTEVLIYIRSSNSQNDILLEDWSGPYYNSQASGVDLSHFSGQYMQFKVELTTQEKGITPTFHRATLRVITSEAIHFFTTNFTLSSKVQKGILTSQKIVPVAADVVFGINTTNSVDWNDYQVVEENRLFDVTQIGENIRVGIKLLSPSRSLVASDDFDEYGPYGNELSVNTLDFYFTNNTGESKYYHFKTSLYEDSSLENLVYSSYSFENQDGYSFDGVELSEDGAYVLYGDEARILFNVPGSANIKCNTYYYAKIEIINDFDESGEGTFETLVDDITYISSCNSSFIDVIDFNFTNNEATSEEFDFRIKFYTDQERTTLYATAFSQNDRTGWYVDDVQISEDGVTLNSNQTANIVYSPDIEDFTSGTNYYLTIDALDKDDPSVPAFSSNSYTFQVQDSTSLVYCGSYFDVPIVKNFGIMLELEDNTFVKLNV